MKRYIFSICVIFVLMLTLVSVQAFGQFHSKGVRLGVGGGFLNGLTTMNDDYVGTSHIFLRHNIADYFDGDLSGYWGGIEANKHYQTDLFSGEYKVLYKPFTCGKWEPYLGAGLGITYYYTNGSMRKPWKERDGYIGYLPVTLGAECALSDRWQLDINTNLSYAFSNEIVSSKLQNGTGGNDAWWGIFVGVSYTIFEGGMGEAEKEAIRVKAEQDAMRARELAIAEARRVQDSINAAAAEAARIKEANAAEARRLQEAAEAQRLKDSVDAAAQRLAESKKPAAIKAEVGKAIVLEGVKFKTGSAIISSESELILSSAKRTLEENPEINVEIRGYTDNVGSVKKNLEISQNRAAAVKAWLVKNGIDGSRITAKGFGVKDPIGDNSTSEGRQKNRRIEFFRTK